MRYVRTTKRDLVDQNIRLNANGCNSYTVYNIGNTEITLDGILPLQPGEQYEGANENPEVFDYSDIDIVFGLFPVSLNVTANKDNRCIITRSYITKSDERITSPTTQPVTTAAQVKVT